MNKQQQQDFDERMQRAGAFEQMVHTKGWEYITSYYQNKLQVFASRLLNEDKPITEYEAERNELKGIKKIVGEVSSTLEFLNIERKKKDEGSTE